MIIHEWRSWLDDSEAAEVRTLAAEAADYDNEAGFSRVLSGADHSAARRGSYQILVRVQPQQENEQEDRWPLAAYLRVDVTDGVGTVRFVVHPEYRSLGIGTLSFEKLGVPPSGPDGWCGTGAKTLRVWAEGDHPAADRMARRLGAERVRRMWLLRKRLSTEDAPPGDRSSGDLAVRDQLSDTRLAEDVARVDRGGRDLGVSSRGHDDLLADSDTLVAVSRAGDVQGMTRLSARQDNSSPHKAVGTILTLSGAAGADPDEVGRALLRAAVERFRERGIGTAQVTVDADVETIVRLTRELGFEHDRSDVCYRIG